ncbi:MAG: hypothetical protein WDM86_03115 [Rhizomicrobium sp.]
MTFSRLAAVALLALIPLAAQADPRQDLVDGLAKCGVIADSIDRLSCYDALYAQARAAPRVAPFVATGPAAPAATAPVAVAPPAAASPVAAAPSTPAAAPPVADNRSPQAATPALGVSPNAQTKPEQFGGENLAPPPPPPGEVAANQPPPGLDSITAIVQDYSFTPYDKFIVVLDNGQIWRQLESDSNKAHFMKGAQNTVTISRGLLGSYNLVVNDSMMPFKVKRLK